MKRRRLIIILFILGHFNVHSQDLTTIFIDSLRVIINNDTLINDTGTRTFFVKTNQENKIVVYDNGNIKIVLEASNMKGRSFNKRKYASISSAVLNLYAKDTIVRFSYGWLGWFEKCGTYLIPILDKNWVDSKPKNICSFQASMRIFNMAPKDTAGYKLGYKEGIWIGREKKVDSVVIEFKNDKINGLAEVYYKDGTKYKNLYKNGKSVSPEILNFNFDAPGARPRRPRVIPKILTGNCEDK